MARPNPESSLTVQSVDPERDGELLYTLQFQALLGSVKNADLNPDAVYVEMARTSVGHYRSGLRQAAAIPNNVLRVVRDEQDVVLGFLEGTREHAITGNPHVEVLQVIPEAQGRGIGSLMLNDFLMLNGFRQTVGLTQAVTGEVLTGDEPTLAFAHKMGATAIPDFDPNRGYMGYSALPRTVVQLGRSAN